MEERDRLLAERAATELRVAALEREFAGIAAAAEGSNGDDEHDPEGATVGFERAQVSALLERSRARVAEVDAALARLGSAAYGVCASCGRPIPPERLEARPTATRCVPCGGG
ncbi:TraR/DksA family transcriptional regulator [Motilibacter rhizosphaerae]|uniref:TraR/DksA family transcriptional regulator n=1 Tax=Motilibacter rhizosphaerae TaxID=598652 RepID=A0A4Q7NAN2_9ACTN|nr:TraR/DksA C4-type zinc finger protein [Motilibacter rhizosphaerae]RZS79412.1 TraR/DksA family transcriptional regulator [Motilibacter rhizosphaerae]